MLKKPDNIISQVESQANSQLEIQNLVEAPDPDENIDQNKDEQNDKTHPKPSTASVKLPDKNSRSCRTCRKIFQFDGNINCPSCRSKVNDRVKKHRYFLYF